MFDRKLVAIVVAVLAFVDLQPTRATAGSQNEPPPIPLQCGKMTTAVTIPPNDVRFSFFAEAGDRVDIEIAKPSGGRPGWSPGGSLEAPSGNKQGFGSYFNGFLGESGVWVVRVSSGSAQFGDTIEILLNWISPAARQCSQNLSCGHFEKGSLNPDGFHDFYRFFGLPGDIVQVHLDSNAAIRSELWDPAGRSVGLGSAVYLVSVIQPGFYTLGLEKAAPTLTPSYRLFIDWISPKARQCGQTLACGDVASGDLTLAGGFLFFHFDGDAGDIVDLDLLTDDPVSGWDARGKVYRPDGSHLGVAGRRTTLDQTGTYTVVVENTYGLATSGPFRLGLNWLFPGDKVCARHLACGVPIGGMTTAATPRDYLVFDAAGGETLRPGLERGKTLASMWDPRITLTGPDGRSRGSVGAEVRLDEPGLYVMTVDSPYNGFGSFTMTPTWTDAAGVTCASTCQTDTKQCFTPSLEFIDYDDPAFRTGTLTPEILALNGRPVAGLGADGVTKVLVRVPGFAGPGDVTVELADDWATVPAKSLARCETHSLAA